jgi:hypothetical protein
MGKLSAALNREIQTAKALEKKKLALRKKKESQNNSKRKANGSSAKPEPKAWIPFDRSYKLLLVGEG